MAHTVTGTKMVSSCGAFSEIYIKLSSISLQGFGERAFFVPIDSKLKRLGVGIEMLLRRVVARYSREGNKTSKTINRTRI